MSPRSSRSLRPTAAPTIRVPVGSGRLGHGGAIARLQQAAGNGAIAGLLRPPVEPEADRKADARAPAAEATVERATTGRLQRIGDDTAIALEAGLSQKYGIRIGPAPGGAGPHFSVKMLKRIDAVLSSLPLSHIRGSYLTHIEDVGGDSALGEASLYTQDDATHGHIGIRRPYNMPAWLYGMLNQDVGWERKLMDWGAKSAHDWSKSKDKELGLQSSERSVFSGTCAVMASGNLLEGTLRHEMGHVVDHRIGWEKDASALDMMGGWRSYVGQAQDDWNDAFLRMAGITDNKPVNFGGLWIGPRDTLINASKGVTALTDAELAQFPGYDPKRWSDAVRARTIAMQAPWMFNDGRAGDLEQNGRIYQVDYQGTFVSYLASARAGALSNYQFASAGEWFAEAYSAYYDTSKNSPARAKLPGAVAGWMKSNLGEPPTASGDQETGDLEKKDDATGMEALRSLEELGLEMQAALKQ